DGEAAGEDGKGRFTVDDAKLVAQSPGAWGKKLRATIDVETPDEMRTRLGLGPDDALFNLTLRHNGGAERFLNLTVTNNSRRIDRVLKAESNLAQWDGDWAAPALPKLTTARTKWKALLAALAENPPVPATIDAAQQAYDAAKNDLDDDATKAEKKL